MNKGLVTFLVITTVSIAVTLFIILAPANMKDKLVGSFTFASNERQCFNFYKEDFVDPDSAYIKKAYTWTKQDELTYNKDNLDSDFNKYDAIVYVFALGRNRMGGYTEDILKCPLINGKFDASEAYTYKLNGMHAEPPEPTAAEVAAQAVPLLEPAQ